MKTKICTKCKKRKRVSHFYKAVTGKDGLSSRCDSCMILYTKLHRHLYKVVKRPSKDFGERKCGLCGTMFRRKDGETATHFKTRTSCSEKCSNFRIGDVKKLRSNLKPIPCEMCQKMFLPMVFQQRFCGSKKWKAGCSYKHYVEVKKRIKHDYKLRGSRFLWLNTTKIVR